MDLQNTLKSISKFFLKNSNNLLKVVITKPCSENLANYSIAIHCKVDGHLVSGGGVNNNIFTAFFKGLVELGESIIMYRDCLPDRSGIAGGLTEKNIILRAKSELLERDAFLFHYKNRIPFLSQEKLTINGEELIKFELETIDPNYSTIFITNPQCASGKSNCLLSGVGTHLSKEIATQKAIEEYSTMKMVHEKYPNWCPELHSLPAEKISPPDFHHLNSKDERNKTRIKKICQPKLREKTTRNFSANDWKITKLESPLRFFKYFRVEHIQITKLEFMKPEENNPEGDLCPLYHPFW